MLTERKTLCEGKCSKNGNKDKREKRRRKIDFRIFVNVNVLDLIL